MTKILNHINTYANLTAYNNDKDKNYPNIAYIIESNEVKWVKEKVDLVVCKYNVTSTSEATKLLGSTTGITYQIIDDVKQDTVKDIYTFDTLGEHTAKYKLDGTSINDNAFYKCIGLTSVTIPDSVFSINYSAFSDCTALTSVEIPDSVTSIKRFAFENTPWYNNQPDGLVYAGKVAYKYKGTMPSDTSIVLKEETKGIANNAFENCYGLTNITIPNSVTSIGAATFYNCIDLTSVNIPNSVTEIGASVFLRCLSLESIVIPDSITSISTEAFSRCSSLTSVTIPNSVTKIDSSAFSDCTALTSVEIPNSVTEIGNDAFQNCTSLTSVTILATRPPKLNNLNVFNETNDCPIYVPAESVNKYKNARNWNRYKLRIQAIVA